MVLIRAQVVLPFFTNLPTDVITNTLWFAADDSLTFTAASDLIAGNIEALYTGCYAFGGIANYITPGGRHINFYNMNTPPPRVPYTVAMSSFAALAAATTPTETAMVLSFQALPLAGMPQSRRRGRIYLGGITASWFTTSTTSTFPIFHPTAVSNVATAAGNFEDSCNTDLVPWVVWSSVEDQAFSITDGWVDNSPDTQRRRSVEASARTLWS